MVYQITKIEPQKKNKERFTLQLNSGEIIGVSSYIIAKYKITTHKKLTEKELQDLVFDENLELAKQKAFDLISRRPRSKKEIEQKLNSFLFKRIQQKRLKNKIINKVFKVLEKYDYLNDKKFAKWVLEQRKSQLKGPLFIKRDLIFKGVDKNIINHVLKNADFSEEIKKAYIKIEKKAKNEKDNYKKKRKIYSYLARQGFYLEDINNILTSFN